MLCRLIERAQRTTQRAWLATRFWLFLGYPWSMAWIKAER